MPTTFDVFYLGIGPEFDTVEGNLTSENHAALQGLVFGGTGSPLALNVQVMSPDPVQGFNMDANTAQYAANNAAVNERFLINGGAPQTHDGQMIYNNSLVTYTDGTTALVSALVMQDTAGRLYLLPPSTANAYSAALEAKPILSLTLGTASPQFGTNVWGTNVNRYDMNLRDFLVEGTAGNDVIDNTYVADPDGDRIDNSDMPDGSNDDTILAGAGNDSVVANFGNDVIYAGTGDDTVFGGAGDDWAELGAGNDSFGTFGTDSAGNDTVFGADGNDNIIGGAGNDILYGDAGRDTLSGGMNNDTMYGGADADQFNVTDDHNGDTIFGGETTTAGGSDNDLIAFANFANTTGVNVTYSANETGSYAYGVGATGSFSEIESLSTTIYNDTINAAATTSGIFVTTNSGDDSITGGSGSDTLYGGDGNDVLIGGEGADTLEGQNDRDTIYAGIGDVVDGGEGGDDYDTLDLTAWGHPATNIIYDANNPENGTVEFLDVNGNVVGTMTFTNIENVVACFTPGAMVLTEMGEVAVESLVAGDRVLTRDSGFQTIRWVGRRDLTRAELIVEPRFNPVFIGKGALGAGVPERDMMVSPQHRMLICSPRAELMFGEHEVLVAAKHLVGLPGIEQRVCKTVSYIHLLFDQHEIVRADGAWSESFQPGAQTLEGMGREQMREIITLFPELEQGKRIECARLSLKRSEARVLWAA